MIEISFPARCLWDVLLVGGRELSEFCVRVRGVSRIVKVGKKVGKGSYLIRSALGRKKLSCTYFGRHSGHTHFCRL